MAWVEERAGVRGTRYIGLYRDPDGAKRSAGTFSSRREAARAANREEQKVLAGSWHDTTLGEIAFRDYVENEWLPNKHLEITTRAAYTSYLNKQFYPAFGNRPLNKISPSLVQDWVSKAHREGLSPRSIKKYHVLLSSIFRRAVRDRVLVHNPCASRLTFLDEKTRMRRDHVKYLKLIEAVALLFQYQRDVKTLTVDGEVVEYVEATLSDVALAGRLASEGLGRSLDELPPQTRRLLDHLDRMVTGLCEKEGIAREDLRFSRRDVRAATGWGDTQLKVHMARLVELEYLLLHRGGRGQSFVYELLWRGEGKDGSRFLPGLLDVTTLAEYDGERSGLSAERSAPGRPSVGGWSGAGRGEEDEPDPAPRKGLNGFSHEEAETPLFGATLGIPSYPPPEPNLLLRRAAGRL